MVVEGCFHFIAVVLISPLLPGIINKTKAWFAGRDGPSVLQVYWDLWRLLRKGAVFSESTSYIFQIGATVQLAAALGAALIVPSAWLTSPFGFTGDVVVFAYVLGLGRFFTMASAMDTGSSFEAMGASREGTISAFAEPALFLSLGTLCIPARSISFERVWHSIPEATWVWARAPYLAVAVSLFIVMLAESSRIPVDDPNTHLELTMVHEVMVLDHSGPDLAFIELASALKLFVLGSIIVHIVLPATLHSGWRGTVSFCLGQVGVAGAVGIVESTSARYRLNRVPQFILAASVIAVLAIAMRFFEGNP